MVFVTPIFVPKIGPCPNYDPIVRIFSDLFFGKIVFQVADSDSHHVADQNCPHLPPFYQAIHLAARDRKGGGGLADA
jgi:hypothetical protein